MVASYNRGRGAWTMEQIKDVAPAVFNDTPALSTTEDFVANPLHEWIEPAAKLGWHVVGAKQNKVLKSGLKDLAPHSLWFRHESQLKALTKGETIIEGQLTNAMTGRMSMLMDASVRECICDNQMVMPTDLGFSHKVPHIRITKEEMFEIFVALLKSFDGIRENIDKMRDVTLSAQEVIWFGEAALTMRYGEDAPVSPRLITVGKHREQRENNLWNVFNRVQENIIRGGLNGTQIVNAKDPRTGQSFRQKRQIKTRAITSIQSDLDVNRQLWAIADKFLQLKGAA